MNVCAVIVTYNRVALLERCVAAMLAQSRRPDRILIVDNASTDGTAERMHALAAHEPVVKYHRLPTNTGGAGGFSEGIRTAIEMGDEWVWVMDDDAVPHEDALQALLRTSPDPDHIYGSLAVQGEATSWTMTILEPAAHDVRDASEIPELGAVRFVPFLGLMVSRDLVRRIGLPDAGYFIAADDVEYCMRAQRSGARVHVAGLSRIEHPRAETYDVHLPGRRVICLRLPPWKRYYDTRNRLLIAREYYGLRLYTQTIPGSLLRMLACLLHEKQRARQLYAFAVGMIDGLLGLKGPRHIRWRITP